MRLISARLHPFGALVDRTYSLQDGVQALLGRNEFGKSTFREAVFHALFTPTNLTPARLRDTIGPWYPLPRGTSAAVTLRFSSEGKTYTLEKRWGAGAQSLLSCDDGSAAERDHGQVQERLARLVGHDEATYRRVLFTSQDEMARTIADLREGGLGLVSRAAAASAGAKQIAGDVDLEQLSKRLREEVDDAYARWDIGRGAPIRDAKTGQGSAANPWKKGVGAVLESWYGWQRAVVDVASRRQFDERLDLLTSALRDAKAEVALLEPDVRAMELALAALSERELAAGRLDAIRQRTALMREADREWSTAEAQLPVKRQQLAEKEAQSLRLERELETARRVAQAKVARAQLVVIRDAETALERARAALQACKPIEQSDVKSVQAIEDRIRDAEIRIAAQKLAGEVVSNCAATASITSGTEAPQPVALVAGQPVAFEANGQVAIALDGVTVTVKSGLADIDALLAARMSAIAERCTTLEKLGCRDLSEVVAAEKLRAEAKTQFAMCDRSLATARQGRSAAEWEQHERELAELPACRDEAAIQAELTPLRESIGEIRSEVRRLDDALVAWTKAWGDRSKLSDKILDERDEERQAVATLETLPARTEGGANSTMIRAGLVTKKAALESARARMNTTELDIASLEDPGEADLEGLRLDAQEMEAHFRRELAGAESKQRVLDAIEQLRGGGDPFEKLSERIEELFVELAGGAYAGLQVSDGLPTNAERADSVLIPAERLSVGAAVSLSLAVRIVLAESTLVNGSAMLLLDDPLVDLDESRRRLAAKLLAKLGEKMQVVILTCHDHHAAELGPARIEVTGV